MASFSRITACQQWGRRLHVEIGSGFTRPLTRGCQLTRVHVIETNASRNALSRTNLSSRGVVWTLECVTPCYLSFALPPSGVFFFVLKTDGRRFSAPCGVVLILRRFFPAENSIAAGPCLDGVMRGQTSLFSRRTRTHRECDFGR